jgi:pSer/pThr/pTyr-binding forkhead associated (FHA) protein
MWKLVIEDDEGKRTVVPLSRDDYTIGRQEGNTIRLTERNVSRTHGRVRRTRTETGAQVFVLEDVRSYNGLFVNGLRVAHTQDLQHGDLIQIGDYRIVLEDDAATAAESVLGIDPDSSDAKATIPIAPTYRGQTLGERPNRLVMLVGPTPGVEYPLDRDRMTIGRAEDASISVNHNSVSRVHCEVHALGDGRFEIVDKASSNGVRVNAVELRRSIIEAGDVIELGDVRFKFVGAGQIFVPGPNESQQLTAISDREAEREPNSKRGWSGYVLPIVGAGFVGAMIIVLFVWIVGRRAMAEQADAGIAPSGDNELAQLMDAKNACTLDDCEQAHATISAFAETSPLREHSDYRQIMATWAESLLRRARAEQDVPARRATLGRLLADPKVDPAQKKQASDMLESAAAPPPTPEPPPSRPLTPTKDAGPAAMNPAPAPRTPTISHVTTTNATTSAPQAAPAPKPTAAGPSAFERAREAGARGEYQTVRNLLEARVRQNRASAEEANLVKQACKILGDRECTDDIKAKYP